ncbi:non-hydrolyzing UDP-N-acetylglucosamine 2-epimerase [Pseudodesulfovibrio methanolicus]|uniref:UDP-N-acetylglucosamine 2-epimerase (non-hydrolyzing) n=1 Tax=Pseudodesulfovibrio methanolicus TaxID=3126690 RepID=A0ABZ2IVF8_9BACT
MKRKVLVVFGTRPEAIKMVPVIYALKEASDAFEFATCVTAQHREMLDQVLELFGVTPDFDLNLMRANQSLEQITSLVIHGVGQVCAEYKPDVLLVHGDTTTTFAASLAAFYNRVPVGHVEAGLRTWNKSSPWPEEMNRCLTGALSSLHFAPTEQARQNLIKENVSEDRIDVTGNTVIDALLHIAQRIDGDARLTQKLESEFPSVDWSKRIVLVTGHRRENFGKFEGICKALEELAGRPDVEILYPVHLNPNVRIPVFKCLENVPGVHLCDPVEYLTFTFFMMKATLILTDSGGVQEEAPSLGKPVLVMRDKTERPEAIEKGTALLVGVEPDSILQAANRLLDDPDAYAAMAKAHNPFGDGRAAHRIITRLRNEESL